MTAGHSKPKSQKPKPWDPMTIIDMERPRQGSGSRSIRSDPYPSAVLTSSVCWLPKLRKKNPAVRQSPRPPSATRGRLSPMATCPGSASAALNHHWSVGVPLLTITGV
jgi:hypothetical protein